MTDTLTNIEPLRQSTVELMACPHTYGAQKIEGRGTADTEQSYRGTEVHDIMRGYVEYCGENKVAADWLYFDKLASHVSGEAGRICDGIRDGGYIVDWEHVIALEDPIALDKDFQPVPAGSPLAEYQVKPDALFALSDKHLLIKDYKSHPMPFDPETPQSLMYPVAAFQTMPWVEMVTFELLFVRYANCTRAVTWTRKDLPKMMAEMARWRARQKQYHFLYDTHGGLGALPAIPYAGCHYCPLLQFGDCPVADRNPQSQDPEELVRELVFLGKRAEFAKSVLKNAIQARGGAIVARDYNGTEMSYGPKAEERTTFPAQTILPVIQKWCVAAGDQAFLQSINLSSTTVKSKLDTNKRRSLQHEVEPLLRKKTEVKTKLTTADIGEAEPEEEW